MQIPQILGCTSCTPFGAALTMGTDFRCADGKCVGANPAKVALFKLLQSEINRVRKVYGLAADLPVDGIIGPLTAARLIRLARTISSRVSFVDPAIDTYAIETATLPGPQQVATDAADLVAALKRNGYDVEHTPPGLQVGALVDPYLTEINAGGGSRPNIKPIDIAIGPTSNVAPPSPRTPPATWQPAAVAGIGLFPVAAIAVVGAVGLGALAWALTRRRVDTKALGGAAHPFYYLSYRVALQRAKRLAAQTGSRVRVAAGTDERAPGRTEYAVAKVGEVPPGFTIVAFADPAGNVESSGTRYHRMMERRRTGA